MTTRLMSSSLYEPKNRVPSLCVSPQPTQNAAPTGAIVGVNQSFGSTGLGPSWFVFCGGEGGVEAFELFGDDLVVGDGVGARGSFSGGGVGDVDEVDDDTGALDVLKELDAEAVA